MHPAFSGNLDFEKTAHSFARVKFKSNPVIYMDTWNHSISVEDTNPNLEKIYYKIPSLDLKKGSRLDSEREFSMIEYDDEIVFFD